MRLGFQCSILGFVLAVVTAGSASAQSCGNAYDFNTLTGSDAHPFTPLDGQDGWSAESYNTAVPCGVTATLGYDGTQALRFQEVGPGFGCDASRLNDANYAIPTFVGDETSAFFQVDFGVGYWGNDFGLAYDVDGSGQVRRSETGELGPYLHVGSHANVGITLVSAAGNSTRVSLGDAGGTAGGDWLRLRVVMDLTANGGTGSASVDYINLTHGGTDWTSVPGLQGIDLELSSGSGDATDPVNWHAVWLHFEGATNQLDNIDVGLEACGFGAPFGGGGTGFPCPCANNNDGSLLPDLSGCAGTANPEGSRLKVTGTPSISGDDVVLVADHVKANAWGLFFKGDTQLLPGVPMGGTNANGLLQCTTKIKRFGALQADGTGYVDSSGYASDLHTLSNAGAGDTRHYQWWYRTPKKAGPCSNPSPGGSNTSNGYTLTWLP